MKSQKLTGLLFAIILSLAGCTGDVEADEPAEENEPPGLSIYNFDISDSSDDLTNSTGDNLVDILMTQGENLNWSSVEKKLKKLHSNDVGNTPGTIWNLMVFQRWYVKYIHV